MKLNSAELQPIWNQVQGYLTNFAADPAFSTKMQQAFGPGNFDALQMAWAQGNLGVLPAVEVRPATDINGANGAFAGATNTIYLSQEFYDQNEGIAEMVLEEYGHYLDWQINSLDSPGDEGDIFARLARGQLLTQPELSALQAEDDTSTIILDGEVIEIEQTSVSDSGGFEGSRQTIQLESNGGGTARYSFEFFSIPDQFIIRYEGQELLNTGFVSGGRTGQVQIPQGNSDQLQVIVATNDEGTAWNYNVTTETEPCADTSPFLIELANGEFEDTDGDGDCDGEGTIFIGRTGTDAISRMLRVENGTAEYDDNSLRITSGTVFSEIGSIAEPLFQGSFEIDFMTEKTSSFQESGSPSNEFQLAGLDIDFNALSLRSDEIRLGANFSLPVDIAGQTTLVELNSPDALVIGQDGVGLSDSGKVKFPRQQFDLFDILRVRATDLEIEYKSLEDQLRIQGKITLFPITIIPLDSQFQTIADLTGNNFIQIQDGQADIVGSLEVKNIKLPGGWGLDTVKLNIDTVNDIIGGDTKVIFPFGTGVPPETGIGLGLDFKLPLTLPPEVNRVSAEVDKLNVPIGTTGAFLQKLSGGVNNIAPSATNPIEFMGGIGVTAGPTIFGQSLLDLDLSATVSSRQITGTGKIKIIDDNIVNGQGSATLNWNKKFLSTSSNFSILDGLIETQNSFRTDSRFNINMAGSASVGIPNFLPFGGTRLGSGNFLLDFSNDGNFSNDFAAGWGSISNPLSFLPSQPDDIVVGIKGTFDGDIDFFGADEVPETSSFDVADGTDFLVLNVNWDNPEPGNVPVRVIDEEGNIIAEADFATNNIAVVDELTNETNKTVIIANPDPGVWDIQVVDDSGLGEVRFFAIRDSEAPRIEVTAPAVDVSGGEVTINYSAFDADSDAEIKLFYDDDNQDFDGILIADGIAETDGAGSFIWNTEGVATGEYFIYAMVIDENNPPAFSYSEGRVLITEEADLSVTQAVNADPVDLGDSLTYTITVTNNGSVESKGVSLIETLPEEVTFVSASITPSEQLDNTLTFDLGDLADGASTTVDVTVVAPTTTGIISSTAVVTSDTFDPDATNDADILSTTVEEIPPEPVDLSVTRTDSADPVELGEDFTYTLTVANNGPGDATGIVLTENLPSGVSLIEATLSQGDVFSRFGGNITANLGDLNNGEEATLTITLNSNAAGNFISTTNVTSNEPDLDLTNNSLIQRQTVDPRTPAPADLELSKTVDNDNPDVGDQVNFTLTLTNNGPGTATSIEVTDLLPSGLSFVSAIAEQGTYDSITGVWDVGNIRDNLSRTLDIFAIVDSAESITNTAEVTAVSEVDPDSTPNNNNPDEDDQASVSLNFMGDGGETQTGSFFIGTPGNDNLTGTDGNDAIVALAGNDSLDGLVGADLLLGGSGADTLTGSVGNDILYGGDGNDLLNGGAGDDTLTGDSGQDFLLGGQGSDTFVLSTEGVTNRAFADVLVDFSVGQDRIGLMEGLEESDLTLEARGTNTIIKITESDEILGMVSKVMPEELEGSFVPINIDLF